MFENLTRNYSPWFAHYWLADVILSIKDRGEVVDYKQLLVAVCKLLLLKNVRHQFHTGFSSSFEKRGDISLPGRSVISHWCVHLDVGWIDPSTSTVFGL